MADPDVKKGVYLELLHGRKRPSELLEDWGTDGPIFGPYPFIHTTYAATIRMGDLDMLVIIKDLVYYNGIYYGDWTVTASLPDDESIRARHVQYDKTKAGG